MNTTIFARASNAKAAPSPVKRYLPRWAGDGSDSLPTPTTREAAMTTTPQPHSSRLTPCAQPVGIDRGDPKITSATRAYTPMILREENRLWVLFFCTPAQDTGRAV
jgi:hypothetical protein